MSKLIRALKSFFVILTLITLFLGCDETETDYKKPDYFPLCDQYQWEYQWEYRCDCPEEYLPFSAPMLLKVTGDTVLNGKKYSKIENEYGLLKIVRRESDRYFIVNFSDGSESVFLDTNISIDHSWGTFKDGLWRYEFFMRKPLQKMTVNSVTYHDVLVVEEINSYNNHEFSISTFHYYAKEIGEILIYYPQTPNSYQNGSKFSLLRFR